MQDAQSSQTTSRSFISEIFYHTLSVCNVSYEYISSYMLCIIYDINQLLK